jgi:hypothetical protein
MGDDKLVNLLGAIKHINRKSNIPRNHSKKYILYQLNFNKEGRKGIYFETNACFI